MTDQDTIGRQGEMIRAADRVVRVVKGWFGGEAIFADDIFLALDFYDTIRHGVDL